MRVIPECIWVKLSYCSLKLIRAQFANDDDDDNDVNDDGDNDDNDDVTKTEAADNEPVDHLDTNNIKEVLFKHTLHILIKSERLTIIMMIMMVMIMIMMMMLPFSGSGRSHRRWNGIYGTPSQNWWY